MKSAVTILSQGAWGVRRWRRRSAVHCSRAPEKQAPLQPRRAYQTATYSPWGSPAIDIRVLPHAASSSVATSIVTS